ncbi:MAG: hypothetical protein E4H25_00260 [Methanomassiliicoccus sp.]|nr:MAG: hypothetical protein E4H25_00260 [Methanomassiliicoccus sp.]
MRIRAILAGFAVLLTVMSAFAFLPAKAVSAAANEDVLYIAMQQDIPDFNNYNLGTNSVWKAHVIGNCFEGLSATDYDLNTIKLLAEDWTFDEDALTVDVTIRQGVKFHDGTTMTSEDVYFSYLMARDGTTYADRIIQALDQDDDDVLSETEMEEGLVVIDDYHVQFVMAKQYGQFFTSTLSVPIVPKHIWEDHVDVDNKVDITWGSDVAATIGTGAWKYDSGVSNSYRVVKTFDDYWGKDFMTPADMPTFPRVLDTLYFKIYSNLDTAILALQGGDVDYIAWTVTSGRVPALQSDPNIGLEYMSDAGYFYLAFNMKREPMNNLTFRKAVSHMIDKDQIVDIYMGGFGQAGSAAVSPFFGEWYNPAVEKYPFDIALAEEMLDDAGYIDVNGDGWRELPGGDLMDKITLLCPPADYDPVRIRAGQMIATNMRSAGINVEAKAIDFNTLVAKLTAFDYQMLELGWSFTGYTECVSVLFDIYSPTAGSNSWGFWSEANPNPWYSSLGGVSTLADETTQAMADDFVVLEDQARETFDIADQIDYVKQGQAIVADAVVCNVLYYRVNVEAHNKIFTNWTVFDGTLINPFCFAVLEYSGTGGTSGGGAVTESLDAGLTMAQKVACDDSIDAYVLAVDNMGEPVAGATVAVEATNGVATVSPASGTTSTSGVFEFTVTGTASGVSTIWANVTSAALTASDSSNLLVTSLGGIGASIMPDKTVLETSESMDVEVLVTDVNGDPVEGATVTIDPYLLGYGTIDPSTDVTGADGMVTLVYTAPDDIIQNQHQIVTLAASVSHEKYTLTNLATSTILIYNPAAPIWHMTTIDSVSTTALSQASPTTTITVMAMDVDGDPIEGETLGITYTNDTLVDTPETDVVTDASGMATFDVTFDDIGADAALMVTIGNRSLANSIMDSVTLTYSDTGASTGMYGGYVQYATPKFVEALGTIDVDIYVFDSQGNPADGITGSVVVVATANGQLTDWSGSEYNSLWDYAGINIVTDGDGQNIVTAGSYSAPEYLDEWVWDDGAEAWVALDALGVDITGGVYSMTIEGVDLAHLDLAMDLFMVPDSTADYNWDTYNHDIYGQTTIASHYGYGRAMNFTTVTYEVEKPVLQAKASEFDMSQVTVIAYDENGDPIDGAEIAIYEIGGANYEVSDDGVGIAPANGTIRLDIMAAAYDAVSDAYDAVVTKTNPEVYLAAYVDGSMTLASQTQLVVQPLRESVYVTPTQIVDVRMIGDDVYATVEVLDATGAPYADLPVSIGVSIGTAVTPTVVTDADGMATFVIDTSGIANAEAALIAAGIATGGLPEAGTARMVIAVKNLGPEIVISSPVADGETSLAEIMGMIYDSNGIASATLALDEDSANALTVTVGSSAAAISYALEDLATGEHTIVITATDSLGVSSEMTVTFTLTGGGTDVLPWIIAAVGWIVAAVVIVMMFLKMKGPSGPKEKPDGMAFEEPAEPVEEEKKE